MTHCIVVRGWHIVLRIFCFTAALMRPLSCSWVSKPWSGTLRCTVKSQDLTRQVTGGHEEQRLHDHDQGCIAMQAGIRLDADRYEMPPWDSTVSMCSCVQTAIGIVPTNYKKNHVCLANTGTAVRHPFRPAFGHSKRPDRTPGPFQPAWPFGNSEWPNN